MTKTFYTVDNSPNPDPENGVFYTIHHREKRSEWDQRIHERKMARQAELMAEINKDPVTKYLYDKDFAQGHAARRLAKTIEWSYSSHENILAYVRANWNNSEEPTIVGSKTGHQDENYSNKMTYRSHLKNRRKLLKVEQQAEAGILKQTKYDSEFIDKVKRKRAELSMTQAQLASLINKTENDVANFEKNELIYDGEFSNLITNVLFKGD